MITSSFLTFLGLAALLTITPGADTAVVTRAALANGRGAALLTTLGINAGVLLWAAASALGLAALLDASAVAFTAVKLVGAAYLIWLGAQSIWQSRARAHTGTDAAHGPGTAGGVAGGDTGIEVRRASFRQGLLSNLFNPKVGVFYTTFLPQFIAPGDPVFLESMLLATIHDLMGFLWLSFYAYVVVRAGDVLRRPSVKRALDRVTGAVLILFGLRLATEQR